MKNLIKYIDWNNYSLERAGIIPYIKEQNVEYYCLGVDRATGELTDFGGGIKRRDLNPLRGAIREFEEESLCAFGVSSSNVQLQDLIACIEGKGLIIFYPYEGPFTREQIETHFQERLNENTEIKALKWFTYRELKQLLELGNYNGFKIYERTRITLTSF